MGDGEPHGISVGQAQQSSTTGWHWLPCRQLHDPGGQVDARERCVYNTSLYSNVSLQGLMVHDSHRDYPCS